MMGNDDYFCPLCQNIDHESWKFPNDRREYLHCNICQLVFTPKNTHPEEQTAKTRYQHHLVDAGSTGHINHLMRAIQPVEKWIKEEMSILDYGCGPKPVLSTLLGPWGCSCCHYDLIFFPSDFTSKTYDIIFCIETAEHFSNPDEEFRRMDNVLKPGGLVVVMTSLYSDKQQFSDWYYKRDFTHISFFHRKTITFLAGKMEWACIYEDKNAITVFKKLS
jgi:hypothetical protein